VAKEHKSLAFSREGFAFCCVVGKRAYLAGPSRTETIAESMPMNIIHARIGATQSPALLGTFFDPVL
jgi:hypothetical protein